MLQHAKLAVVTAALTLALTACGGSDGEQDSAETETPRLGRETCVARLPPGPGSWPV
ncbi:MAG: hypothetical protein HZY75_02145 [Nocardioidaceae bacterium]|nr:MAG: hypothetical protein HZY75_02145 [Nocardioidaceae bacterium]